jgi:hypothetical protein
MEREMIDSYLAAFQESPAEVMDRMPEKRTPAGAPREGAGTAFDVDAIATSTFVKMRDDVRSQIHDDAGSVADVALGKAPIEKHDRAQDLVDEFRYDKLSAMEDARLLKADLPETPWSDDYWGIYLGVLGNRYADPNYPASQDWKQNYDYVTQRPAEKVVASGNLGDINLLSPSEKYDLLVGDAAFSLTKAMWAEGKATYDSKGSVETWMGICHGWAPASYNLARPRKAITVRSPSGLPVHLYPSDIKALCSLLWAYSSPDVRFIGTRCNEQDPPKDENGRVLSSAAFDTNPGTWHLAMVNQIGVAKRSLVMDATYDYQVWNQPLAGYEYHYFNPNGMRSAATLREATVARGDFTRDRFAKYRSRDYVAAVGVAMRTRYVSETAPYHAPMDEASADAITVVDYFYDLELDGDGRILGGEWYLNRHPDFLWGPARGVRAVTPADAFATEEWSGAGPVPASWRSAAVRASADGLPLAKIVERLVALANG